MMIWFFSLLFGGLFGLFFRNKLIFNDEPIYSRKSSFAIYSFVKEWKNPSPLMKEEFSFCPKAATGRNREDTIRHPPSVNVYKINFDGFKLNNANSSFGFVIRDHAGEVLLAGAKSLGSPRGHQGGSLSES